MTPELFAQALNASEARAPSAARLAAEAFFAPRTASASEAPPAEVTVVRHKMAVAQELTPEAPVVPSESASPEVPRAPRVFRLDAGTAAVSSTRVSVKLSAGQDAVVQTEQPMTAEDSSLKPPGQRRRLPRKQARQRHGEVTIIRPNVPKELLPAAVTAEYSAGEPEIQGGEPGSWSPDAAWPRYPALLRQLRLLQAEAAQVRASEVATALRWIKAAIHDHGITAQELGLR